MPAGVKKLAAPEFILGISLVRAGTLSEVLSTVVVSMLPGPDP